MKRMTWKLILIFELFPINSNEKQWRFVTSWRFLFLQFSIQAFFDFFHSFFIWLKFQLYLSLSVWKNPFHNYWIYSWHQLQRSITKMMKIRCSRYVCCRRGFLCKFFLGAKIEFQELNNWEVRWTICLNAIFFKQFTKAIFFSSQILLKEFSCIDCVCIQCFFSIFFKLCVFIQAIRRLSIRFISSNEQKEKEERLAMLWMNQQSLVFIQFSYNYNFDSKQKI